MQSVCFKLYDKEQCGRSIFDDIVLEFTREGETIISVSYCSMDMGCFCNASRLVRCCKSPEDVAVKEESKKRADIANILDWERRFSVTRSSYFVTPSWACG